ncbi:MAG: hypothetical protein QOF32_1731 [Gammaproteobacteria bacterium]|jgi:hypothetical protein|nr:hypothetical protein [Gammaproteobacteria bacterium]
MMRRYLNISRDTVKNGGIMVGLTYLICLWQILGAKSSCERGGHLVGKIDNNSHCWHNCQRESGSLTARAV